MKRSIIPALIAAGICLFFQRSGFFTLFFLAPLGFVAYRYNFRVAWTALLFAVLGNALLALGQAAERTIPAGEIIWPLLYFALIAAIFTWITAAPPGFSAKVPGSMRLMFGSCLGALLFIGIFFRAAASPGFPDYISSMINTVVSMYRSSGSDVVQNALLESLTADVVLNFMKSVILRGGSLIACVLLFFISRQVSFTLARLTHGGRGIHSAKMNSLAFFHVYPVVIWFLSASLLLVVLTRMVKFTVPEIILWNVLMFCAIMYLAQGLGILQFFLLRPSIPPFLRLVLMVVFIILLFSPGINAVLLVGVALLGIAENWVPFRAPKTNEPPSTPEAGDGGN